MRGDAINSLADAQRRRVVNGSRTTPGSASIIDLAAMVASSERAHPDVWRSSLVRRAIGSSGSIVRQRIQSIKEVIAICGDLG
jgi:hypothetical protein